jgi:hypothetical protein
LANAFAGGSATSREVRWFLLIAAQALSIAAVRARLPPERAPAG